VLPLLPCSSPSPQQQLLVGAEGEAEAMPKVEARAELSPEQ